VYRITPEGSEELENWLAELLSTPVDETPVFRVAVGLLGYITQDRAEAALATRIVSLRARVMALDATLKMAQDDLGLPRLVLLELEHAMALAVAEIEWIRSLVADMETGALVWNEELIRAHFEAMHAADAERRNRHRQNHLAELVHPARDEHRAHTTREETP
jgi:DNA-binding PadR family transcriptional regulator